MPDFCAGAAKISNLPPRKRGAWGVSVSGSKNFERDKFYGEPCIWARSSSSALTQAGFQG